MQTPSLNIKSWAIEDRPREKLAAKGRKSLTDVELLAIVIGQGTGNRTAVDLARDILNLVQGNLNELGKLTIAQLKTVKGIGEQKAIIILATLELGARKSKTEELSKSRLIKSYDVYQFLRPNFVDLQHEEFFALFLNRRNEVIQLFRVSTGGLSSTLVDPKLVFSKALECKASLIVLAHNHPSGHLKPSDQDEQITAKLVEFGKLLDMYVIDHLIISDYGYFSFADEGLL